MGILDATPDRFINDLTVVGDNISITPKIDTVLIYLDCRFSVEPDEVLVPVETLFCHLVILVVDADKMIDDGVVFWYDRDLASLDIRPDDVSMMYIPTIERRIRACIHTF